MATASASVGPRFNDILVASLNLLFPAYHEQPAIMSPTNRKRRPSSAKGTGENSDELARAISNESTSSSTTQRPLQTISERSSSRRSISLRHSTCTDRPSETCIEAPLKPNSTSASTRKLSSFSSYNSLRSTTDADMHTTKKRKRLLPFQIPSRGESSTTSSRPASRLAQNVLSFREKAQRDGDEMVIEASLSQIPPNLSYAAAKRLGISLASIPSHQDVGEDDNPRHALQDAMAQLPANLKPAAAKRLGIQLSAPPTARSSITPSPVVRSRANSLSRCHPVNLEHRTEQIPSVVALITKRSASNLRSGAISPTNALRPEHPLEVEARMKPTSSTFFSASSDSGEDHKDDEDDDNDKHSSGYSYASSYTSYGVASPIEPDMIDSLDGASDGFFQNRTGGKAYTPTSCVSTRAPAPQSKGSESSLSSFQTGHSGSAPIRQIPSFSRPLSRPSPHSDAPAESEIREPYIGPACAYESKCNKSLAAITEDLPILSSRPHLFPLANPPRRVSKTVPDGKSTSGFRNFSRPHQTSIHLDPCLVPKHSIAGVAPSGNDVHPVKSPKAVLEQHSEALISAEGAEKLLLRIFEALDSFDDLFACARLNKGFHAVFKKHELRLLKNSLRNLSPPQWELREASPREIISNPGHANQEYSPTAYVQFTKRDGFVLSALKRLMLQRSQAHLRYETVQALAERDPVKSARVDDAYWRIWTFCMTFGTDTGQAHDIDAQVNWLNGGITTQRPASPRAMPEVQSESSRVNPPVHSDSFGRGNYGGLSVDELDDMTEIWNALKQLLRGISRRGRVEQARCYGLFDTQVTVAGERLSEQVLLDEWVHWLATQGLPVINDLATYADLVSPVVFATARSMEWTDWTVPQSGRSRSGFLHDAITRVHEEKKSTIAFNRFEDEEPLATRRKSRGMDLAAKFREQERGFELTDYATIEDKSLSLWMRWMSKNEGKTQHLATADKDSAVKPEPKPEQPAPTETSIPRPTQRPRRRSSSGSLSLFPPQYSKAAHNGSARPSPTMSPMLSRRNSILRQHTESKEYLPRAGAGQEQNETQPQTFSPRLSTCAEK